MRAAPRRPCRHAAAPAAAELRSCYADWEAAIGGSWQGRRRLDELRAGLFAVL